MDNSQFLAPGLPQKSHLFVRDCHWGLRRSATKRDWRGAIVLRVLERRLKPPRKRFMVDILKVCAALWRRLEKKETKFGLETGGRGLWEDIGLGFGGHQIWSYPRR